MFSCISSGRGYGFELEIVKPSSPSSPSSGSSLSPTSSTLTLSESSNSPRGISVKRARAPRKRRNQTYDEAAALLSAVCPTVFSAGSLTKLSTKATLAAFPESPDLLPPFPVLSNAAFLIHRPLPEDGAADIGRELKHKIPADRECASPASTVSWDSSSPAADPFDDDFDAESILDEEVGGGIDSILGATTSTSDADDDRSNHPNPPIYPLLRSLIGQKMGAKFELGLGFGRNLQRALRRNRDGGDWWSIPTTVSVRDINPEFKPIPPPPRPTASKKKKMKVEEKKEAENAPNSAESPPTPSPEKLKAGLGLKLNHEEVLTAWSGRGSMFTDGPDSLSSSADTLMELADVDLFLDAGGEGASAGGVREASVLRYKEKRRTRLFSRKIRYEVRKTNADRRPRMKGRFVRRPSSQLLQQTTEEEESQ